MINYRGFGHIRVAYILWNVLQDVEMTFNRPHCNNDRGVKKEKLSVFACLTCMILW